MFRVTAGAVGPVVVLAVTVSACGAVETPAGEVTTHRVGGEVRGLWRGADGVALRLEADGASSLGTAGNGAFQFDRQGAPGQSFRIPAAPSPARQSVNAQAR